MVFAGPVWAQQASGIPKTYDLLFQGYSQKYMPGVDSDLLKAQCWQESRFNNKAVSSVGAAGLCQFMPGTFKDVSKSLGLKSGSSVYEAKYSIQAAAFYMAGLRRSWASERSEADRHNLALASYNAGTGNLLKAQRLSGGSIYYRDIILKLPMVTGTNNSKQTSDYVIRIRNFYAKLKEEKGEPVGDTGL